MLLYASLQPTHMPSAIHSLIAVIFITYKVFIFLHFVLREISSILFNFGLLNSTFSSHAGLFSMGISMCRNYAEKFQGYVCIIMIDMFHTARYTGPVSGLHVIIFALNFDIAVSTDRIHKMVPIMRVLGDRLMGRKYKMPHNPTFPESVSWAIYCSFFNIRRKC